MGDDFNRRKKDQPDRENDHSFDAVIRLQGRSCLVAQEILTLVRAGYASGAHARWRTLHELAVVAAFIHEHGDEVALRYLDHDDVERYKAALGFQEHAAALNEDPLTDEEMSHLRESYEALCAKYGSEFANAYGWAASALPRSGWSFAEIEQAMNQEHVRPMYKMASNAIHPNAGGSFVDLGLMPDDEIILAGPSTAGLADPAFSTCGSLFDCTRHVLDESPDLDGAMAILVLELLLWRVADAFQSAHDEHEARAQRAEAPAASEPEGPDGTTVAP